MLGVLLHPDNEEQPLPIVMTGPASSEEYFRRIDEFVGATLGPDAQKRYSIVIDEPRDVARQVQSGLAEVRKYRTSQSDAYYFNWRLNIEHEFQQRFVATHDAMRELDINEGLPTPRTCGQPAARIFRHRVGQRPRRYGRNDR